jgi:hypothetical protein
MPASLSTLEDLAGGGFSRVPPTRLGELAENCWADCEETGDARYCILASAIYSVDRWWQEHDQAGGVPAALVQLIEAAFITALPEVLTAEGAEKAAQAARGLRIEVEAVLTGPSHWPAVS